MPGLARPVLTGSSVAEPDSADRAAGLAELAAADVPSVRMARPCCSVSAELLVLIPVSEVTTW
jgi:hypothetical protein